METFDPPPWMGGFLRRAADTVWDGAKQAAAHPVTGLLQESTIRYQYRSLKVPIAHHAGSSWGQDLALAGGAVGVLAVTGVFRPSQRVPLASMVLPALSLAAYIRGPYPLPSCGICWGDVVRGRQFWRLGTAPMVYWTLPQLLVCSGSIIQDTAAIARARGSLWLGAHIVGAAVLSQGLYVLLSWAGAKLGLLPEAIISTPVLTPSALVLALKVVASYTRLPKGQGTPGMQQRRVWDWTPARADVPLEEEVHLPAEPQTASWAAVCLLRALLPRPEILGVVGLGSSSLDYSPLPIDMCGILAGLLLVYGLAGAQKAILNWRQRALLSQGHVVVNPTQVDNLYYKQPGLLGWGDLGAHAIVGIGTTLTLYLAGKRQL